MTLIIIKNYSAKESKNTYCMQSVLSTIQLANLKEDSSFSECISRLCRTYVVLYQETARREFCQFWLNSNCNLDCKSEHCFLKRGKTPTSASLNMDMRNSKLQKERLDANTPFPTRRSISCRFQQIFNTINLAFSSSTSFDHIQKMFL